MEEVRTKQRRIPQSRCRGMRGSLDRFARRCEPGPAPPRHLHGRQDFSAKPLIALVNKPGSGSEFASRCHPEEPSTRGLLAFFAVTLATPHCLSYTSVPKYLSPESSAAFPMASRMFMSCCPGLYASFARALSELCFRRVPMQLLSRSRRSIPRRELTRGAASSPVVIPLAPPKLGRLGDPQPRRKCIGEG